MVEIRCVWETLQKIYDDKVEKVQRKHDSPTFTWIARAPWETNFFLLTRKQLEN